MKLTIDVCESDTMTIDEVAEKIAKAQGWTVEPYPSNDPSMANIAVMKTPAGRVGQYDVLNDILIWNDDPNETEHYFFDDTEDEFFLGNSLMMFLDVSTTIWGEDEDGNWVLYTE